MGAEEDLEEGCDAVGLCVISEQLSCNINDFVSNDPHKGPW